MSSISDSDEVFEPPLNLYCWNYKHCNPRKCSAAKLTRLGMLKELPLNKKFNGLILYCEPAEAAIRTAKQDGHAHLPGNMGDRLLSMDDIELAKEKGLMVVDASWNRIVEMSSRNRSGASLRHALGGGLAKSTRSNWRSLPYLIASSPTHYGKPVALNCAEAIAAALVILGRVTESTKVMDNFSYGVAFFSLNEEYLSEYLDASVLGHGGIVEAQTAAIMRLADREPRKKSCYIDHDLLPSSTSSDQD